MESVKQGCPELLKKPKIHLLLHLPDKMQDFGPPSAYNTERFAHNIHNIIWYVYKLTDIVGVSPSMGWLEHKTYTQTNLAQAETLPTVLLYSLIFDT